MRNRVFITFIFLFLASANVYASGNRVALVIGNSHYTSSPLSNPSNDAKSMSLQLSKLGFTVSQGIDLDRRQMRSKIREFGNAIKSADVGLFYFAGHGLQFDGDNYLIPVNANIQAEDEIIDEAINASFVLRKMKGAGNPVNIVILDACRNNPYKRSFRSSTRGLSRLEGPKGTLIAYATAPGSVASDGEGGNGLYTQYLIKYMQEPVPIEKVFKKVRIAVSNITNDRQIPWENSSLVGEDVYFNANYTPTDTLTVPEVNPINEDQQYEEKFWSNVNKADSKEMYVAYLEQFPNGDYTTIAQSRLNKLQLVAYVTINKKSGKYRLVVSDSDYKNPRVILMSPSRIYSPVFSSDRKDIAYISRENNKNKIFIQRVRDGKRRYLGKTDAESAQLIWSPDGEFIHLTSPSSPTVKSFKRYSAVDSK